MGAAISLPLLSFFALPAFTSYGTSMNLLFFTLNWYILLLTHPPLQVEIIGISLVQTLLYLLPGLLFLGLDAGVPSLASAVKTQGDLSLPVRGGRGARKRVAKIVGWSIFNVALGVALLGGLETLLTKVLLTRHALSLSKTMPMPYAILKSVALLLAIRGVRYIFLLLCHSLISMIDASVSHPSIHPPFASFTIHQTSYGMATYPTRPIHPRNDLRSPNLLSHPPLGTSLPPSNRPARPHTTLPLRPLNSYISRYCILLWIFNCPPAFRNRTARYGA